jgi:hypothetical protein
MARFFDRLAFPTAPELLLEHGRDKSDVDVFPDDFGGVLTGGPGVTLFWHYIHNSGWTTIRITEWMRRQDPNMDRRSANGELSKGPDTVGVFMDSATPPSVVNDLPIGGHHQRNTAVLVAGCSSAAAPSQV